MKVHPALIIAFFLFGVSCKQAPQYVHPRIQTITQSVYASGVIQSTNQYQVFARTNGVIDQWLVAEGDFIQAGQVIAIMSNPAWKINQENAQTAAGFNALANNRDKLNELKNTEQMAYDKRQFDSIQFARQKALWKEGIGTQNDLDQREMAWLTSDANWKNAVLRRQQLNKQLQFSSTQSKLNFALSQAQSNDLAIRSQIRGQLFTILKKSGEMLTTLTPAAIIGDTSKYLIELQVDEYDITRIKLGQSVFITMDSYKGKVFEAEVKRIIPYLNERTKSCTVEAVFKHAPEVLYPNLSVEANIVIQQKENAMVIPVEYLVHDTCVVLKDKQIKPVQIGLKDYRFAEIVSGLEIQDELILPTP